MVLLGMPTLESSELKKGHLNKKQTYACIPARTYDCNLLACLQTKYAYSIDFHQPRNKHIDQASEYIGQGGKLGRSLINSRRRAKPWAEPWQVIHAFCSDLNTYNYHEDCVLIMQFLHNKVSGKVCASSQYRLFLLISPMSMRQW